MTSWSGSVLQAASMSLMERPRTAARTSWRGHHSMVVPPMLHWGSRSASCSRRSLSESKGREEKGREGP